MGWETVTAMKITFDEPGMTLEGTITSIVPTELGPKSYVMKQDGSKDLVTFLGTHVLDRFLEGLQGRRVHITYKGDLPTSRGFKVKDFEVKVWEDELPVDQG